MIDSAQVLLFIVIIILTVLLVVLGVQVFLILRDLRVTIAKANKVLDNADEITESVKGPVTGLSQAVMGIKAGASLAGLIKKVSDSEKEKRNG